MPALSPPLHNPCSSFCSTLAMTTPCGATTICLRRRRVGGGDTAPLVRHPGPAADCGLRIHLAVHGRAWNRPSSGARQRRCGGRRDCGSGSAVSDGHADGCATRGLCGSTVYCRILLYKYIACVFASFATRADRLSRPCGYI